MFPYMSFLTLAYPGGFPLEPEVGSAIWIISGSVFGIVCLRMPGGIGNTGTGCSALSLCGTL